MNYYKLLKRPFLGKLMVKWRNPLSEEEQKRWQQIKVSSKSDGVLSGLFATVEDPKATIVLGHPMAKDAKGYFLKHGYTDMLLANNYNVIVFDINGFGESTHGNFSYFEDILAIGQKAKQLTPNLPIGYHGISLGGQWASISFADDTHCYDFAIIESAASTLDEYFIHFPLAYSLLKILNVLFPTYKRKVKMVERIRDAKKLSSILFIYSEADEWVPISMGKRFHENCAVASELWTVSDAKHTAMMKSKDKEAYKRKILAYFDESVSKS